MPDARRAPRASREARVLMLAGPTGIGKTALAVELAQRYPLEIISADSMQVYRGLEIGTAQPTPEESARARFHGCGVLEPAEPFNVARFLELCDAAHREIIARGRVPIYVGGTGLYMRALRWGLFEQPSIDPAVRRAIEAALEADGPEALHRRLAEVDAAAAARIAPRDGVRLVRALEVWRVTGRALSSWQAQWDAPRARFAHCLAVLHAPRAEIHRRIERRSDAMLAAGWIDEVRALLALGVAPESHCFKALGYREILAHVRGELDGARLRERIVAVTRQFARGQMIWLRRERPAIWIESGEAANEAARRQLEKLLEKLGTASV